MINHNIKQILIIIFLGLYTTGCDKKDPASSSDPIPDGLTISYPSEYVDGIVIVGVEGSSGSHEDHADDGHAIIRGFQLEPEGESSYSYRQLGLAKEGTITINLGETVDFAVHFLDCEDLMDEVSCTALDECEWHADEMACEDAADDHDHGDVEHCEDFSTEADCGMHSECEWHEDDSACEDAAHEDHGIMIEITGVSIGTTEFQIVLMHAGHADYTSLPIPVTVVNPTNPE